jgi:hypothetical protein
LHRQLSEYGKLPLVFEANNGQADASVKFLSRSAHRALLLTQDAAILQFAVPSRERIASEQDRAAVSTLRLRRLLKNHCKSTE